MAISTETTEKGVTERRFDLKAGTEVVPGILWEPEDALAAGTPRPPILIGHGGTQHKRSTTCWRWPACPSVTSASAPPPSMRPATASGSRPR